MAAENAFDLPTLSIHTFQKTALHLTSKSCGWPTTCPSPTFDGYDAVSMEFVAYYLVKRFGIASGIPEHTAEAHVPMSFAQDNRRFERVAAGTESDRCAEKKMRGDVDTGSELRPARDIEALLSASRTVVMGGVAHFESSAVAGGLPPQSDQPATPGATKNAGEEELKVEFFKRRNSARQSVEYVGTACSPNAARTSDHSCSS